MHSCFSPCKTNADCYLGFNFDEREKCPLGAEVDMLPNGKRGILCVSPEETCETLVTADEACLNEEKTLCISWKNIWAAILILNCLQLIFEGSMAYALEISLKPTNLDRLENNLDEGDD